MGTYLELRFLNCPCGPFFFSFSSPHALFGGILPETHSLLSRRSGFYPRIVFLFDHPRSHSQFNISPPLRAKDPRFPFTQIGRFPHFRRPFFPRRSRRSGHPLGSLELVRASPTHTLTSPLLPLTPPPTARSVKHAFQGSRVPPPHPPTRCMCP